MATSKPHYAYGYALSPLPQESVQIIRQPVMRPQPRPPPPLPSPINNAVILPVPQRREHALHINESDRFLAYANANGNNFYVKPQAHRLLSPTSVMIRPRYVPTAAGNNPPVAAAQVVPRPIQHATGAATPSGYGYLTPVPRSQIYRPVVGANSRVAMMQVSGQYPEGIRNSPGPSFVANSNSSNVILSHQQQYHSQSATSINRNLKEKNIPQRKKKIIRIMDPKQGNKDVTEEILQNSFSSDASN